ncbi:F-box only protein 22-like [Haliotis cracherodii]|uniref:F-box only protein 22-like n=1 Tax=Haliotis cracherodii TaxID=6455 RepID=UPI0039EC1886
MATDKMDCYQSCSGAQVLSNPIILKNVLSCIPMKSLQKCARVCRLWALEVEKIKKTRHGMVWHYFKCPESEQGTDLDSLVKEMEAFIENLYIEPHVSFIMCSTNLHEEKIEHQRSRNARSARRRTARNKTENLNVNSFLVKLLPSKCNVTAITADGIVGTSSDMRVTEEMEGKRCLSLVVFSQFNNIRIQSIYYDQDEGNKIANCWSSRTDFNNIDKRVSDDEQVKGIIFLSDEAFCPQEIGFSLYKIYKCPMIAGGFVDNVVCPSSWFNDNSRDSPFLCCMAFCGRVQVASVVLKDDVKTTEGVDRIIKKLKDSKLPEKNSIGLMFACVGRGENHYGEINVESTVFRKYFPNTPLVGFFGNGEVGFEYPHVKPADVQNCSAKDEDGRSNHKFVQEQSSYIASHPPKMYHAYTTIMSLFSFQ